MNRFWLMGGALPLLLPVTAQDNAWAAAPAESVQVATSSASLTDEARTRVDTKSESALSFHDFIQAVADSNLNYAAQKFSVPIAQAQVSLARLWPNPTISGGYNTPFHQADTITGVPAIPSTGDQSLPSSTTASLSETIPLGGKLSSKEAVAQTVASQAEAQLQDYFRNLRATAAGSYIDALTAELVVEQKQQTYDSLQNLADLNAVRFKDGDIAEADWLEARIAALQALNDLHTSESALRQSTLGLAVLVGRKQQLLVYHPIGNLALPERTFDLTTLVNAAVLRRSDVVAALHNKENAEAQLALAKANRVPDVTASLNYTHNSESQNVYSLSPENDDLGFTLQVPLPFSNFNNNDLKAAHLTVMQADRQLEAAQVQAETDVRQALARYHSALEAVQQYSGGILQDAERARDIILYSYKKGSATLLAVRQAESDLNATYQSYYAALNEEAKALISLEQAAGIWDVEL